MRQGNQQSICHLAGKACFHAPSLRWMLSDVSGTNVGPAAFSVSFESHVRCKCPGSKRMENANKTAKFVNFRDFSTHDMSFMNCAESERILFQWPVSSPSGSHRSGAQVGLMISVHFKSFGTCHAELNSVMFILQKCLKSSAFCFNEVWREAALDPCSHVLR